MAEKSGAKYKQEIQQVGLMPFFLVHLQLELSSSVQNIFVRVMSIQICFILQANPMCVVAKFETQTV